MRSLRAVLVAIVLALVAGGPACGASTPIKKVKAEPSVMERVGSATTGFFKGIKDALTFKRQPAKKPLIKSSPFRGEQTKTAASSSWFAKSRSK